MQAAVHAESCCLHWLVDVVQRFFLLCVVVATFVAGIPGMLFARMCQSEARLDGKTVVVTGANTGIGKETALELVRRGARVVLACRDPERGRRAAADISARLADCPRAGELVVLALDLASLNSVRRGAGLLLAREPALHVLVNNAGVFSSPRSLTEDGIETQLGVNHVGHFLLTLLLLPRMLRSSPARIINVTSMSHISGRIDFDDLNMERSYSPYQSYARSKLANILFTRELADRLRGTGVTTYAVHPGCVATDITRHLPQSYSRLSCWLFESLVLHMTPQQGAQTTVHCAVDEAAGGETGLYYSNCRRSSPFWNATDKMAAAKLWDVSLKLTGLTKYDFLAAEDPGPTENSERENQQERHSLDTFCRYK
ncbi:retinol dehydrogenase 11-like isoform X2 [Bacillus rossius redtenbacheri]